MNRFRALLIGLALLGAPATTLAQSETGWSRLYLTDLEFARRVIAENHPGPVDAENPEFRRTLESAYEEARNAAPQVKSYTSYSIALRRFGNRFQDAHLSIKTPRPMEGRRSAGIYPVWKNDAFVVETVDARYGEAAAALRGATIESCDGIPASRLFADHVLSWRGRPSVAVDWFLWAPILLVSYGPPLPQAPARCRFQTSQGPQEIVLQWKEATSEEVQAALAPVTAIPPHPLRTSTLADGTIWVDVPTFLPQETSEIAAMRGMIDSLAAELRKHRDWKLLVFDLRGNEGGNTRWVNETVQAVFGEEWNQAASRWLHDGFYMEWRVSKDNLEALQDSVRRNEEQLGKDHSSVQELRSLLESMNAAMASGRPLAEVWRSPVKGAPRPPAVPVPGRIVLVTSLSCFSACLDFLDRMRLHPAVVQVGQTSGVDTVYLEAMSKPLPSGLGEIQYPMKVDRNRKRKNNEAYAPQVTYDGSIGDTEALQKWIAANYRSW